MPSNCGLKASYVHSPTLSFKYFSIYYNGRTPTSFSINFTLLVTVFRGCRRNERRETIDSFIGDYQSIFTPK